MKRVDKDSKKQTSLKFMHNSYLPKLLSDDKLIEYIKSIDLGDLMDMNTDFCYDLDDEEVINGVYRDLEAFLKELSVMSVDMLKLKSNA